MKREYVFLTYFYGSGMSEAESGGDARRVQI